MNNFLYDCITDWHWWLDCIAFLLFELVIFAWYIIGYAIFEA